MAGGCELPVARGSEFLGHVPQRFEDLEFASSPLYSKLKFTVAAAAAGCLRAHLLSFDSILDRFLPVEKKSSKPFSIRVDDTKIHG